MAPACHMLHGGAASASEAAIHIYDLITSEINTFHVVFSNFSVEKKENKQTERKQRTANWGQAALTAKLGGKVLSILHFVLSSAA